jgi:hypothetical protein
VNRPDGVEGIIGQTFDPTISDAPVLETVSPEIGADPNPIRDVIEIGYRFIGGSADILRSTTAGQNGQCDHHGL